MWEFSDRVFQLVSVFERWHKSCWWGLFWVNRCHWLLGACLPIDRRDFAHGLFRGAWLGMGWHVVFLALLCDFNALLLLQVFILLVLHELFELRGVEKFGQLGLGGVSLLSLVLVKCELLSKFVLWDFCRLFLECLLLHYRLLLCL